MSIRIATHEVAIYRTKGRGWRAQIQPELTTGTVATVTARTRKGVKRKAIRHLDMLYAVERFVYPENVATLKREEVAA